MSSSINWTRYANGDDEVAKGIDGIDGTTEAVRIESQERAATAVAFVRGRPADTNRGQSARVYVGIDLPRITPLEARRFAAALLACADVAEGEEVG